MESTGPYLEIEIGGLKRDVSDLEGVSRRSMRLRIPEDFPAYGLERARVDLEVLSEKVRERSEDIHELIRHFLAGRNSEVERLVKELGIREADFLEQGGGIFWVVVIVGVLCCASEAY
jgi:hypothetical protein